MPTRTTPLLKRNSSKKLKQEIEAMLAEERAAMLHLHDSNLNSTYVTNIVNVNQSLEPCASYDGCYDNGPIVYAHAVPVQSLSRSNSNRKIPSIYNLSDWFDHFDRDRSGYLEREEMVSGIERTFKSNGQHVSIDNIRDSVYALWTTFNFDKDSGVDKVEFLAEGGIGESVQAMMEGPVKNDVTAFKYTNNSTIEVSTSNDGKVKVVIPLGMDPGQVIKVQVSSTVSKTVTIPDYSKWKTATGEQFFFI